MGLKNQTQRIIKFRGQRKDNKQWVYGYYFIDLENKKHYIHLIKRENTPDAWMVKSYEVDEKTVGQFTGLHDKNGKEIYEGDKDKKGRVCEYFEKLSAFGFKHPKHSAITFVGQWINDGEIIGNIHENNP